MPLRLSKRVLGLAVLLAAAVLALVSVSLPYQGYSGQKVVVIEQGLGRRAIAARLASEGVLSSRWPFLVYAYLQPHRTLKAGEYVFDRPLSAAAVFSKLARGEVHLYALTIPEGWTRWDIADEVARLQLASREAFLEAVKNTEPIRDLAPEAITLEGYLFPDTYHFARPSEPAVMVRVMVEHFRRVSGPLREKATHPAGFTAHQLVTLASLVEKETGVPGERGLIAAVFYNRLQRRFPLQCDPTVIYAARLAADGPFDGVINMSDLERDSPYNTYKRAGLPPGPIANPGRAALAAALTPPASDFLYFVSNNHGGHQFARSGAEHERNVARYRAQRATEQRRVRNDGNRR